MKDWHVILKEKYKDNKEMLVKIAEDWMDYTFRKSQHSSGVYLWLESDNEKEKERRHEDIRENIFYAEEIENRFAFLLGQDYTDKLNQLRKKLREESEKV